MDLAGGGLCLTGLEIVRACETEGRKYYRNSILPCAAEMKRTAALVERFSEKVGLNLVHNCLSDGTEYLEVKNVDTVLQFIMKAYRLNEVSKERSISLSTAIDGAQLSKRQTHTTMGLKVNDKQAICPIANLPIFGNILTSGSNHSLVQSRNCCFPLKMILAAETKDLYQHFESLFGTFNNEYDPQLTDNGSVSSILGREHKPIKCNVNCDLCAQWKGLKKGGAMKQKKKSLHLLCNRQ